MNGPSSVKKTDFPQDKSLPATSAMGRISPLASCPQSDIAKGGVGWKADHLLGPWPGDNTRLALPPADLSDEPMQTVTYQLTVPDIVDARAYVYNRLPLVRVARVLPFTLVFGCLFYGAFLATQQNWEGVVASVGWLAAGLALIAWMYSATSGCCRGRRASNWPEAVNCRAMWWPDGIGLPSASRRATASLAGPGPTSAGGRKPRAICCCGGVTGSITACRSAR
jgi:hypothetical protein